MSGPIVLEMYQRAPERFRAMMFIDTIAAPASTIETGLWSGFAEAARPTGSA
jgi:pimeloyl-ACP methyl ester carboxylesterase